MSKENESALEALELELQDTDMSVTPNEIRNAEFATTMRGFSRDEVDAFLQKAASTLEDALTEIIELRGQQKQLQAKYDKLAAMEDSLKSTLLEAQKTADTIRANAEHDAQLTIERAKGKQSLIEKQAQGQIDLLQEKVRDLDNIRLEYQRRIRETIESHLKVVDEMSFEADLPELSVADILSDTEPAEIEEVTLFETAAAETATEQLEEPSSEETESVESESETAVDSLHADIKDLTEDDTDSSEEENEPTAQPESPLESIAQSVQQVEHTAPPKEPKDDTLYKKLASGALNTAQSDQEQTATTPKQADTTAETTADKAVAQSRPPLDTGPDGIVVFGRKEDREKAVEENARILSELDSVVDKFAEELRELDSK